MGHAADRRTADEGQRAIMNDSTQLIFEQFGISLLLGLLVGLQRQRTERPTAGLRTFPLITVLGTVAAALDAGLAGGWVLPAGLLGLVAVVGVNNLRMTHHADADYGLTTEAAMLLMYLVGAYCVVRDRIAAIAIGAGVAILLQFKPELHGVALRLGDADLRAIMTFALITCIILPVLPNKTYEVIAPLDVLNPFEIWLMAVLMVGISLGGYLIYKFLGRDAGILLGGLLGGAISSTATTLSYARRARESPTGAVVAALVIVIAAAVVNVRVILEILVAAPQHFGRLAAPVAVLMAATMLAAAAMWLRVRNLPADLPQQSNPTELRSAIVFAGLYAGVLMALSAGKTHLGGHGLYGVAILSGLTDMDAITLSAARLVQRGVEEGGIDGTLGWRLIVTATLANLCFKWLICLAIGRAALAWRVGGLFAVSFVVGCVLLWWWP
jgi:uncharacterized membrane protein (DUF4010 family)